MRMAETETGAVVPILRLMDSQASRFVFSAKPKTSPWNWLSLAFLAALAVSAFFLVQSPSDAAMLACAVAGLGVISFGSIYLVFRRSHRTMALDFGEGSAVITESLGADKETAWRGSLTDFRTLEYEDTTYHAILRWQDDEIVPTILAFPGAESMNDFLSEASRKGWPPIAALLT